LVSSHTSDVQKPKDDGQRADISSSGLTLTIHDQLDQIDSEQWNRLVPYDAPMLRHEFLSALESSGAVCRDTGWKPCHLALTSGNVLVAAAPCYLKSHSYGEFIFDWAWARAYQQSGLEYYPKLLVAVPFTPITGRRLLTDPQREPDQLAPVLVGGLRRLAEKLDVSSVHCLFSTSGDNRYFRDFDFVDRTSHQFHWQNYGYTDFQNFLGSLSSKKRKNILRERRRVREAGIRMCWLDKAELTDQRLGFFFDCYSNTIAEHGSYLYLNREFFRTICTNLPDQVRMLVAERDETPVAAAFFLCGEHSLYGRYWGALEWVPDLHFETCYYAPIEYCITNGLSRFEAGAQGEHKLSRGLMPAKTLSAHWLSHSGFHDAVKRYTREERQDIERYTDVLAEHSPFRQG